MTQLVVERMDSSSYGYKLAPKYGTIYNPYNRGKVIKEPSLYVYTPEKGGGLNLPWGAEVLYQAEFFQLLNTDPERLQHLTWEKFKRLPCLRAISLSAVSGHYLKTSEKT